MELNERIKNLLVLSTVEFCSVLIEIGENYPPSFMKYNLKTEDQPTDRQLNSNDDPYVQKYKLVSGVYRISAFLGWLEICRQDFGFIHNCQSNDGDDIKNCIEEIKLTLHNSELNPNKDGKFWKDALIYEDEQRAIGERMITLEGSIKTVLGYARFCETLFKSPYDLPDYWISVVINFLYYGDKNEYPNDFRPERLKRLFLYLVNLIEIIDSRRLPEPIVEYKNKLKVQTNTNEPAF